jgi:chemotaxis protein methyltransferase CheR
MTAASALRDFDLTDADFARIAALVRRHMGITLAESKRPLVYSRLARRLRALRLDGFPAYLDLLASPDGTTEREELISAVTTNVTAFFRESHHFDTLRDAALPALIDRARAGGRVRLWSAGCSSGEEPYSIAATLAAACPDAARLDIRILATDIDRAILARAEAGLYPDETAAALPADLARLVFPREGRGPEGQAVADPLRRLIRFRRLNLIDTWPMRGPFDVIFCRNVMIYFDRPAQEEIWQRFASLLAPGGWLMIGHSERVSGPAQAGLSVAGITTYRKHGHSAGEGKPR